MSIRGLVGLLVALAEVLAGLGAVVGLKWLRKT
jgi:hypothetical protein